MKFGIEERRKEMNDDLNEIRRSMNKETRQKAKECYEKRGDTND